MLIYNAVFLGLNLGFFIRDLIDRRLGFAALTAVCVPFSLWGIHVSARSMRMQSKMYMEAYTFALMQKMAQDKTDNKST